MLQVSEITRTGAGEHFRFGLTEESLYRDFPGGPVMKNPPSNAGDSGLTSGHRTKIPHAGEQLNPLPQPGSVRHSDGSHLTKRRFRKLQLRPDTAK